MIVSSSTAISCQMVVDAKAGDKSALQVLLLRSWPLLKRQLQGRIPRHLASQLTVDDLLQETFVKAVHGIEGLRSDEPAAFVAWIKQIAESELVMVVRRAKQLKRGGDQRQMLTSQATGGATCVLLYSVEDRACGPRSRVARGEALEHLRAGIGMLPAEQRRAVELCYGQGMNRAEAARFLNRSEGAVRNLLMRAKQQLRVFMKRSSLWLV